MNMNPRVRILHLEDDPNDREFVQIALARDGIAHQVFPVTTRTEFMAALETGGFDVILSDSKLPGFDGWAAVRMAKARFPEVPFLFVTGYCPPERAASLMAAGANAAVCKSDLESLAKAVMAALKIKPTE